MDNYWNYSVIEMRSWQVSWAVALFRRKLWAALSLLKSICLASIKILSEVILPSTLLIWLSWSYVWLVTGELSSLGSGWSLLPTRLDLEGSLISWGGWGAASCEVDPSLWRRLKYFWAWLLIWAQFLDPMCSSILRQSLPKRRSPSMNFWCSSWVQRPWNWTPLRMELVRERGKSLWEISYDFGSTSDTKDMTSLRSIYSDPSWGRTKDARGEASDIFDLLPEDLSFFSANLVIRFLLFSEFIIFESYFYSFCCPL